MVRFYSVDEAAKALTLSHWTIRAWIRDGRLRSAKIGDRRVIRESELQRLIVDDPRRTASGTKAKKQATA
jgi:excisionase family DNA binding protein